MKTTNSIPLSQYYLTNKDLLKPNPITDQELQGRIDQLNMLVNKPRKMTIYDMATKMSQGLSANAKSGRPSSISYGLADGFNAISNSINERKDLSDKIGQELKMMAYQDLQKERAKTIEFEQGMSNLILKDQLTGDDDNDDGLFTGRSREAQAFNVISKGNDMTNPSEAERIRKTTGYRLAYAYLSKDEIITTPTGDKKTRPAYDLNAMQIKKPLYATGSNQPATTQSNQSPQVVTGAPPPSSYTYTGKVDPASGKKWYQDGFKLPNGTITYDPVQSGMQGGAPNYVLWPPS